MTNILTHSSMSTYKDCRRKYYYRYIKNLVMLKEKASLTLGTAVHKGLEHYYSGDPVEKCLVEAAKSLIEADRAGWDQVDFDDLEKQAAIVEGMIRGFIQAKNDLETFEEIMPEYEFLVPIVNPETGMPSRTFQHGGKCDGLFKKNGQWWLREFKTASQIDKGYVDRLKLDTQITSYIQALQIILGIRIVGVIYTVLKKPSIKQKQTESLGQYCERVIQDYQDRPEFYFWEEEIYRDQKDFTEWEYERWDIAKDLAETMKTDRWYRNTSSCGQYGGCAYLPLCTEGERMLHLYKQKEPHSELTIGKEVIPNG